MTFINTDGLSILGPGSEWFWTAFQGIVVALSLWGLLRQVRIQTAQKMREDVDALGGKWDSERMLRHRLAIAVARRDGALVELSGAAPNTVANFWEEVAVLARSKDVDKVMMVRQLGDYFCRSWDDLEPWVRRMREVYSSNDIFCDWEWLVHEATRIVPSLAAVPPRDLDASVRTLEEWVATEVDLRR